MIGILVGVAIALVIAALAITLLVVARDRDKNWELYEIACDDSREWKERYRILVEQTAEERIKHGTMSNLKARANYYAERDRERKTVGGMNELEREAGCG